MKVIVQKFGGTSVATSQARLQAAKKVARAISEGYSPVVVVSAMGRIGEPYATDTLIKLAKNVSSENPVKARELDLLVSCGEIISTVVMVQTLEKEGIHATALTGGQAGIITDASHGEAQILGINPEPILSRLAAGESVVVAGFQGMTEFGDITTLGRGGSDTTATALGAALEAELVEIYTDVEGVMTVDPRIVPEAKMLKVMSYEEICELAHAGAKVVHPRAVEIARDKRIPVKVKSTFSDDDGTLILGDDQSRVITGIAHMPGLTRLSVFFRNGASAASDKVVVLKSLADADISIDFVNTSRETINFTVKRDVADKAGTLLTEQGFHTETTPGCAKVTLVGMGMQQEVGVVYKVMDVLAKAEVPVLQTVDSEITISCLVHESDMERSIRTLHDAFGLA